MECNKAWVESIKGVVGGSNMAILPLIARKLFFLLIYVVEKTGVATEGVGVAGIEFGVRAQ